jgi:hypothetical protein
MQDVPHSNTPHVEAGDRSSGTSLGPWAPSLLLEPRRQLSPPHMPPGMIELDARSAT